jgi:hypothetical protein
MSREKRIYTEEFKKFVIAAYDSSRGMERSVTEVEFPC